MIIVTGATGFIGSNLLAELELRQYKGRECKLNCVKLQ